jgi:hypothetical protein
MGGRPCCCASLTTCGACADNKGPQQFEVVLTGFASKACTSCTNHNDTFILDAHPTFDCNWNSGTPNWCGGETILNLDIALDVPSNHWLLDVDVLFDDRVHFQRDYGTSRPECLTLTDDDIPFDYRNEGEGGEETCSSGPFTCTVSAV